MASRGEGTTVASTRVDRGDHVHESALWVVSRLALGAALAPGSAIDWERTFRVALEERCAVLAWLRSNSVIRTAAPREVSSRWRAAALAAAEGAHHRAGEIRALLDTLAADGVNASVVKGLPLALRLYGDASARPVSDTDLHVAAPERAAAHRALVAAGWVHLYGAESAESTYRRDGPRGPHFLEIHSSLLDDNIVAHFGAPGAEAEAVEVEGRVLLAHSGASVIVFLATHLAKHPNVPLLWWMDFDAACSAASAAERADAERLARSCRLTGFLNWAIDGARDLEEVRSLTASESQAALARLRSRHARPPVVRVAQLSETMADRARTMIAWALPRAQRDDPAVLAHRTIARGLSWGLHRFRRRSAAADAK